eukprot:CAMPEP_0202857016 /NCGR_PEP_ID=MMETSP1391-20130828/110_1 /ASSEMBLY_ACC=CAM_ASM_000867 /TAXON_ID=1034604 /ORGANISM="Chlamydomonas leiostraca, Strain SAG 11-49" /LENGTH=74 /DNA_ID=CAMNT_0049535759 /DNA_START=21 /DNA_END=241 /DNA_ORIENTATION=-
MLRLVEAPGHTGGGDRVGACPVHSCVRRETQAGKKTGPQATAAVGARPCNNQTSPPKPRKLDHTCQPSPSCCRP